MSDNNSLQQQLLDAGVHFGHLRKKWNPKMLPFIFAEKKTDRREKKKTHEGQHNSLEAKFLLYLKSSSSNKGSVTK